MTQPTLFNTKQSKLRQAAADWITRNPQAFKLFEQFALSMVGKDCKFGIGQLTERVRWEVAATWAKDAKGFKINNDLRAYIGRELVARHPELTNYIEFRRCKDEVEGDPQFQVCS